jgi:hypothetical protein
MQVDRNLAWSPDKNAKLTLSIAWSFVLFNYIYADVGFFAKILMTPAHIERFQAVGALYFSDWLMLALAAMMEIPVAMVLLSWVLAYKANRLANIIAGITMTAVIMVTLFGALKIPPLDFYTFFQTIEIAATAAITWYAWQWRSAEQQA